MRESDGISPEAVAKDAYNAAVKVINDKIPFGTCKAAIPRLTWRREQAKQYLIHKLGGSTGITIKTDEI